MEPYFSEKVGPDPEWVPMKTVDYAPTSFWAAFPILIFTRASARFPTVAPFGLLCLHLSITSHALSRCDFQSKIRLRTTGDPSLNSAPRSLQAAPTSSHINKISKPKVHLLNEKLKNLHWWWVNHSCFSRKIVVWMLLNWGNFHLLTWLNQLKHTLNKIVVTISIVITEQAG